MVLTFKNIEMWYCYWKHNFVLTCRYFNLFQFYFPLVIHFSFKVNILFLVYPFLEFILFY